MSEAVRIQPYFVPGERYPSLIGVAAGDDEYETAYVSKAELATALAENAKLRELVVDMWPHVRHRSRMCQECRLPCDGSDECLLYESMRRRMRELGIEVKG